VDRCEGLQTSRPECGSAAAAAAVRAAILGRIGLSGVLPVSRYQYYLFAVMVIIARLDGPLLQKAAG